MKFYSYLFSLLLIILLASCTFGETSSQRQAASHQATPPQLKVVTLDDKSKIAMGETIYVPVYSHIYYENQNKLVDLSATLSIRNTDLSNPIIIASVRYYNTDGQLIKPYLEQPVELGSLASTDFVVARTDTSGGSGANFIVEWIATKNVSEPIMEAVMISAVSSQGISFVSPGRVIKTYGKNMP